LTEYIQTEGFPAGIIVESMHWIVLHRPLEPAALIGKVEY